MVPAGDLIVSLQGKSYFLSSKVFPDLRTNDAMAGFLTCRLKCRPPSQILIEDPVAMACALDLQLRV